MTPADGVHRHIRLAEQVGAAHMRNKYPGCCNDCGCHVPSTAGYFQRQLGRWIVRCIACVTAKKIAKGKPLSDEQAKHAEPRT